MLAAGRKRKQQPISKLSESLSTTIVPAGLPCDYVTKLLVYGSLKYSKRSFYIFICYLEEICCLVLIDENLIIYGNRLLQQCKTDILDNKSLQLKFKTIVLEDIVDFDMDDFTLVYSYYVNMFMKMRGKDYCKRYMGDIGMSLSHSLRPSLDIITNNLKKSETKESRNNETLMLDTTTTTSDTTSTDGTTTVNNTNIVDNTTTNYNKKLHSYQQQSNFISLHYAMNGAFGNEQSQYEYDSSDNDENDDKEEMMDYYDENQHLE